MVSGFLRLEGSFAAMETSMSPWVILGLMTLFLLWFVFVVVLSWVPSWLWGRMRLPKSCVPVHGAGSGFVGSVFAVAFTVAGVQEFEIFGLVVVLLRGFCLHEGEGFAVGVSAVAVDVESSVFGDWRRVFDKSKIGSSFDFGNTQGEFSGVLAGAALPTISMPLILYGLCGLFGLRRLDFLSVGWLFFLDTKTHSSEQTPVSPALSEVWVSRGRN